MTTYLTHQEIFDFTYNAILKQGKASSNPDAGTCVYKGKDGLKCAVGHLIKDEDYCENFDKSSQGYSSLLCADKKFEAAMKNAGVDTSVSETNQLISNIQWCHDHASWSGREFLGRFKKLMREVACEFDLVQPKE